MGVGVSWMSLITEHLLSHPFYVLRRQCQVNHVSKKYHILPYSLVPVVIHLYQRQGITILWKGLGSVLLVRGLTLGVEDFISKITSWPKEIERFFTVKNFFHHLMLKCVSMAIVTPFFAASLVETVQSDIASEKPGFLDVFREGAVRLLHWGRGHRGRLLPIWALVLPTVAYGLSRYLFYTGFLSATKKFLHVREGYYGRSKNSLPSDIVTNCSDAMKPIDVNATFISVFITDVVFFPLETIMYRLHLQGTRTIVDNLDTGYSVLPILTNYQGPIDCYAKTLNMEGTSGLYKGFGVMILQYSVHYLLIRMTTFVITELTCLLRSSPKPIQRSSPSVVYNDNPEHYEEI